MSRLNDIKSKIRSGSQSSVHAQLIQTETNIIEEDKKNNAAAVTPIQPKPKKEKKKKFEELYSRDTVWIANELAEKIKNACEGERGEKTRIINEALREYFEKR